MLWVGQGTGDGSLWAREGHHVTEGNRDCCLYLGFSLIFQDFDRAMANGLRQAKALQGGGDRERRVRFMESEVIFFGCYSNILNLTL